MRKFLNSIVILGLLFSFLLPVSPATAQTQAPYPDYIVQKGDTLSLIAQKFSVPTTLLIKVNNLSDPNSLTIGMHLLIPGLEGVQGTLSTSAVPLGSTLTNLALRYHISVDLLARLNRITSPAEIFTGANLVIPVSDSTPAFVPIGSIEPGQSLLEKAAQQAANPWVLALTNDIPDPSGIISGEVLYSPSSDKNQQSSSISPLIKNIEITPLPLVQGRTITIHIQTNAPLDLSGSLANQELHFFQNGPNDYVALQGIYALANPGLTSLKLSGKAGARQEFSFEDSLLVRSGNYPKDPPLTVDPKTIDPAVTKPEDDQVFNAISLATPQRYWSKIFNVPVDEPICIKSWFGNRRSYNGSPYTYFHAGLDYGVCANLNIRAPAPGVVVFVGSLTVRGNAVIVDHGWGVYSGFWHQSSVKVKVGDHVDTGQIIGQIGGTGRVTGPHLHWEVWVNRVQVDPLDWLENAYPQVK